MEESRAPHLSERGRTCRLVAVVFASVSVPVRQFVAAPVGGRLETRFPSRCRVAREARVSSDCREEERELEIVFAGVVGRVWCRGSREQKAGRRAFRSIQECPVARVKRKKSKRTQREVCWFRTTAVEPTGFSFNLYRWLECLESV